MLIMVFKAQFMQIIGGPVHLWLPHFIRVEHGDLAQVKRREKREETKKYEKYIKEREEKSSKGNRENRQEEKREKEVTI